MNNAPNLMRWNWKTAFWSGLYRTPIFFAAALKGGLMAAVAAGGAEFVFRAAVAGLGGAWTESFRNRKPVWFASLMILVVIPATLHVFEWLLHWAIGTANLKASVTVSVAMTAISTAFNWYAMSRGTLLTGEGAGSFWSDIKQMPSVVFGFVALPATALVQSMRRDPQ